MKSIFQKNLQFRDIWPGNRQKIAQTDVFGHFLDFASLVFLDFAYNDRSGWVWCLVVFLQFAGLVNVFLFLFTSLDRFFLWRNKSSKFFFSLDIWLMTLTNSLHKFSFDMQWSYHKESNLFWNRTWKSTKNLTRWRRKSPLFFCNFYLFYIQEKPLNKLHRIILHAAHDRCF